MTRHVIMTFTGQTWKLIANDSLPRAAIPKMGGGVVDAEEVLTVTEDRSTRTVDRQKY